MLTGETHNEHGAWLAGGRQHPHIAELPLNAVALFLDVERAGRGH
jgi:hypothetical protein